MLLFRKGKLGSDIQESRIRNVGPGGAGTRQRNILRFKIQGAPLLDNLRKLVPTTLGVSCKSTAQQQLLVYIQRQRETFGKRRL